MLVLAKSRINGSAGLTEAYSATFRVEYSMRLHMDSVYNITSPIAVVELCKDIVHARRVNM